jgi:hypothetical protein
MRKYFYIFLVLSLVVFGSVQLVRFVNGDTVTVSATVGTTVTCNTATSTTAFGTLTTASVFTATPNVTSTLSCNTAAGCTLFVNDLGHSSNPGLYNSTSTGYLIASADASPLTAGTEGYGIQATTTANGSGGTLTINPKYNKTGSNVGGLLTSSTALASSTVPVASREVVVSHLATISGLTAAGSYSDTITYSCTGN